ncbi:hypothetical protein [Pontibacter kalidii]|uniref:hypothetical protein n=1 Tax=Pontibacter kalidii TaxID=2592049 RepID=UPI00224EA866|nr:hypothetical protein [Pontibacter kalidii]
MHIKNTRVNKGKKVKTPETTQTTPDATHPVFCFRYLAKDYDLSTCDKEELSAFIKQLGNLSQLNWQQIITSGRHKMGLEKIARKSIKGRIPSWITSDVDHFLALRFQGKKPFVGHRKGNILHVFWIDTKFSLYSH